MPALSDAILLSRRRFAQTALAIPFGLALSPVTALAAKAPKRGIVGQMAPELEVEFWIDAEGKPTTFSMQAQRGKWVYLKCWQSWCPGCHSHGFPNLKKVTDAFADDDRVVPVSVQTTFEGHQVNTGDKVREIQLRYDLPIVMGHDPGQRNANGYPNTMMSYRTGGTPWQVLIHPSGVVLYDGFNVHADNLIAYLRKELAAT